MLINCDPALLSNPYLNSKGVPIRGNAPTIHVSRAKRHRDRTEDDEVDFHFKSNLYIPPEIYLPRKRFELKRVNVHFGNMTGFRRVRTTSTDPPAEGEEEEVLVLPRQRKKRELPKGDKVPVRVVDCYLNDHLWKNNRREAVVEIRRGHRRSSSVATTTPSKSEKHERMRYFMLKQYDPYDVTICRKADKDKRDPMSHFQAETAAYHCGKHLQGNVMPHHLGFFILARNSHPSWMKCETYEETKASFNRFGIFAAFELVPGRRLDMFNVMGNKSSTYSSFQSHDMSIFGFGLPWEQEGMLERRRRFRRSYRIADAAYASLSMLMEAGIGYRNVKGGNLIVYPKFTREKVREANGEMSTIRWSEHVVVWEGFEHVTLMETIPKCFSRDLKKSDALINQWEIFGYIR